MSFRKFPSRAASPAYTYRANIVSIYDGDTMTVDIDLGFGVWMRGQKLRLYGVDTPEIRGEEREDGLKVRDAVRGRCPKGSEVMVQTFRDRSGKYGRWLAVVWLTPDYGGDPSLNEWLIDTDRARPYFGGKR